MIVFLLTKAPFLSVEPMCTKHARVQWKPNTIINQSDFSTERRENEPHTAIAATIKHGRGQAALPQNIVDTMHNLIDEHTPLFIIEEGSSDRAQLHGEETEDGVVL